MTTHFYQAYDYVIRSQIDIPGAVFLGEDLAVFDIDIRFGSAVLPASARRLGPFRVLPGRLLFAMPDVANYLCTDGNRIVVSPHPGAAPNDIAVFLIATALPALMWMRGEIVLHAAGMIPDGGGHALAICGASHTGKSTVLRNVLSRRGVAVGDDTLRVRFVGGKVVVSGLPAGMYLCDGDGSSRAICRVPVDQRRISSLLGAVFILDERRGEHCFTRIRNPAALKRLLMQRHRPRVPRLLGIEKTFLARFAMLSTLPVYLWRRREGAVILSDEEIRFLTEFSRGDLQVTHD